MPTRTIENIRQIEIEEEVIMPFTEHKCALRRQMSNEEVFCENYSSRGDFSAQFKEVGIEKETAAVVLGKRDIMWTPSSPEATLEDIRNLMEYTWAVGMLREAQENRLELHGARARDEWLETVGKDVFKEITTFSEIQNANYGDTIIFPYIDLKYQFKESHLRGRDCTNEFIFEKLEIPKDTILKYCEEARMGGRFPNVPNPKAIAEVMWLLSICWNRLKKGLEKQQMEPAA